VNGKNKIMIAEINSKTEKLTLRLLDATMLFLRNYLIGKKYFGGKPFFYLSLQ
jgi:hypothetical protein